MKDENLRKKWKDFTDKYIQFFLSNDELWNNNLILVEKYIIKNNKRPSEKDKDIEIKKLGRWVSIQTKNYSNNKEIMKDENVNDLLKNFLKDLKSRVEMQNPPSLLRVFDVIFWSKA